MLDPHERMYGLFLKADGAHKIILNNLFPGDDVQGLDIIWYDDTEDSMEKLSKVVDMDAVMGVDVDAIAGATATSQAVVDAVNNITK